ncbi:integral membrane [Fusarium albosuccineum]|uniref:Integral membrane n=1 Tax=Fusarium albosuccineum TaxID=1237068 RepID=A0A8H4LQ64_9HYPO|nr:integral membrane [Fusarium albosuccineum]
MWNATGPDSNRNAPPGVVPDYDNPEDVYWTLNVVMMAICVSFVAAFFFVRIYVKCTINRKLLTEDWTCAVAFITTTMYCVTVFMMARYGGGYHAWEIRKPEYYNWLKWFYASTVVYCPAAFFTKTTILLLMARVFAVERRVSKGIRIFIGFLLVAYLPVECLRIVNCYPIRTYWDPTVANAHCLNQRKMFFSSLSLSILTDILILLIPIPLTWKLRMPMRKKIKIVLLLGAGGVATALTIYRVTKAVQFLDSDDITVDYTPIDILTALEISIGFVCACLPSLNLLIEHQIRKRRREQHNPRWPRQIKAEMSTVKRHFRWISSSTDPSAPHAPSRPSTAHPAGDRMIDLDVELAMLTGQSPVDPWITD